MTSVVSAVAAVALVCTLASGIGWSAAAPKNAAPKNAAPINAAQTSEANTSAASAALAKRLQGLQRYRANFTQVIEGGRGEIVEHSTGRVVLSRPNFHWQVAEPFPQHILSSDAKLWVYDPDLAQVIIKPLDNALQDTPIALLTNGSLVLADNFLVEHRRPQSSPNDANPNSTAAEVFVLKPQQSESLYSEIRLQFTGPMLTQLGILDHLGQYTLVRFSEVERPAVVDSAEFVLDLPPDTDVIEG